MKVYLDSIGCRLNQSEIETIGRQFRAAGHEIVAAAGAADLAVVNTCAVTNEAASDSRAAARRIARAGVPEIIVTGCWATLQNRQAADLPHVQRIIPNKSKDRLVADVLGRPPESFDVEPLARQPLPGLRQRTRAFIKAQDGCNNHCTFCITTVARGEASSRQVADVISDVRYAVNGGAKEVVLTGVHLGSWGQDFGRHLRDLVTAILHETDVPRIRLSSVEPWDLDGDFFSLWSNPRVCKHLHLPLQSGCRSTLKRMARKTTPASFRSLVQAARQVMPDVAITTDMIAGFPGETEAEFRESLEFVEEMELAGGHAFTYSPRPGTGAARMSSQVSPEIRKERNAAYRLLFQRSADAYKQRFLGQELPVLWESMTRLDASGWQMAGLTGNYLRVTAAAARPLWNEISLVALQGLQADGIVGRIAA
ncbi:MAG TPA: MiaB/RimO family radical SAM methylthiotransferase [Anaerolineales bacterium]